MQGSDFLSSKLFSHTMKINKIKDNKIIVLNLLNKRLIKNTNYNALILWSMGDLDTVLRKLMEKYNINRLQASERLKEIVRNDENIWRLKDYEQFIKKTNK